MESETQLYSTILVETYNTIVIAYKDEFGVDTRDSLIDYEFSSGGCIEVHFEENQTKAFEYADYLEKNF